MTDSRIHVPDNWIDTQCWPVLGIMTEAVNRHEYEYVSPANLERIAFEIVHEFRVNRISPRLAGNCDMQKAAECFAAICLRKMSSDDRFDRYITAEAKESLRILTSFSAEEFEAGIEISRQTPTSVGVSGRGTEGEKMQVEFTVTEVRGLIDEMKKLAKHYNSMVKCDKWCDEAHRTGKERGVTWEQFEDMRAKMHREQDEVHIRINGLLHNTVPMLEQRVEDSKK